MKSILSLLIFLITFNFAFSQNDDAKHPILTDRYSIGLGWYFPNRDIKLGIEGNINTEDIEALEDIDFDETLGLEKGDNTFNLNFHWRFSRNKLWSLRGEYFKVGNTRNVTLDEEIEWDGTTYPVGGEASVSFGFGLYRIFFGRAISTGLKHEFSGGLGIHGLNVSASVAGEGFVRDQSAGFSKNGVSVFLPLPNIGLWYIWAPSEKWAFSASVDWFGIQIDNISGGLWNVSPGVTYQIIKNLGVHLNYQFLNFNADVDQDNFKGNFELTFGGPSFSIRGNF